MNQYSKHFTLLEAQSYISRVKFDVAEMMHFSIKLEEIGFNIYTRKFRPGFNPDTLSEFPDEFIRLMDIVQSLSDEGIIVKGIEEGLLDFPALRPNGDEVFLCWKDGEKNISFWHSIADGFKGRRSLNDF